MLWSIKNRVKNISIATVLILGFNVCSVFHVVECKSNLQRKVCSQYNYCGNTDDCENGRNGTINYLRATGPDDALHYVWSTVGYPTIFISRSFVKKANNCLSNFSVSYEEFLLDQQAGSVEVDDSLTDFSFALIFKSLIEFPVDKKKLPAKSAFNPHLANNCAKGCYNVYQLNSPTLRWSAYEPSEGLRAHDSSSSFQLTLKVDPRHDGGYEHSYFPKPWYTANSTTFDLMITKFNYQLPNKQSRLALEVDLVRGPGVSGFGKFDQKFSRDDEYTPSIFYTDFYSFGGDEGSGYIRWKPITYLTHHRKSSRSQQANAVMGKSVNSTEELPGSLARAIFGDSDYHATTMYLVFGTAKEDDALNSGTYTWTGSIGYGDQPDEPFSTLVILIIIIGLGIPAVLTVLAIGFVISLNIYKWHKSHRGGYRRI